LYGYEPSSYTHIGNIDLASLDRSEEADKWLFDVVQPWMENEKYLALEDLFLFDCSTLGDYPSRIFYVLQEYSDQSKL
jgi:pyrimidine-specific ribonucleoside hydrolase